MTPRPRRNTEVERTKSQFDKPYTDDCKPCKLSFESASAERVEVGVPVG